MQINDQALWVLYFLVRKLISFMQILFSDKVIVKNYNTHAKEFLKIIIKQHLREISRFDPMTAYRKHTCKIISYCNIILIN